VSRTQHYSRQAALRALFMNASSRRMRRSGYVNSTILCRADWACHATNALVGGTDKTVERHRGVARDMRRVGPPSGRPFNPNSEAAAAFYLGGR
jgi:hypothetical protein